MVGFGSFGSSVFVDFLFLWRMREVKSCGVAVVRAAEKGVPELLVLAHRDRLDLPKGHCEEGETERQTALRELREETGISLEVDELLSEFRHEISYTTRYRRFGNKKVRKTVVFFAALIECVQELELGEHAGSRWISLNDNEALGEAGSTIGGVAEALRQVLTDPGAQR